ncbi:hypothetical protein LZ31DRAFT_592568 [Colletotrichum somersetense]|nr:hypothetical protein LZ31DRAFT_592568 [Colletotrichum somersetense]
MPTATAATCEHIEDRNKTLLFDVLVGPSPSRTRASVVGLLDYASFITLEYPEVKGMTDLREVEQLRHGGLSTLEPTPAFELTENEKVKLAPGEVYCRWGGKSGSMRYTKLREQPAEPRRKHKLDDRPVTVKGRKAEANSVDDMTKLLVNFYDRLLGYTTGALSESDIQTPSKKKTSQAPSPLLPVPTRRQGEVEVPNLAEMRRRAGLSATVVTAAARVNGPGKVLG